MMIYIAITILWAGCNTLANDFCSEPLQVPNAYVANNKKQNGAGYDINSELKYSCNVGYKLADRSSSTVIRCQGRIDGGDPYWTPVVFECAVIDCGDPGNLENMDRKGDNWTYMKAVTYSCVLGFTQTGGKPTKRCQGDGTWGWVERDNIPKCQVVRCDKPPAIEYGYTEYNQELLTYGATARYRCDPGRVLMGPDYITCSTNGKWDPDPPLCKVIDCGQPKMDYPSGQVVTFGGNTSNGDFILYVCKDSNQTFTRAICSSDGTWQPGPPDCMNVTRNATESPCSKHMERLNEDAITLAPTTTPIPTTIQTTTIPHTTTTTPPTTVTAPPPPPTTKKRSFLKKTWNVIRNIPKGKISTKDPDDAGKPILNGVKIFNHAYKTIDRILH